MNSIGKTFHVRGSQGFDTTISVLDETEYDFGIRMSTKSPWGLMESDERLSKDLFDSCIRTGYLTEVSAGRLVELRRGA